MRYPFDIVSIVRNKTFSVEARYVREEEESPLKVFNHFSRYVLSVIEDKKPSKCNIPVNSLSEIEAVTELCKKAYYEKPEIKSTNTSPAFTKRFTTGDLKGKTPVEVLLENENGKDILNKQYKWLKDNLEKYPKNKELMDAIVDASKLNVSTLKDIPATGKTYTILDIGCRPLIRKKREDGKCFCYEAKIIFDSSRNYPVSVTVKNYYAPVIKTDKGLFNVVLKDKDKATEVSNEFNMTMAEWLNTVEIMSMSKQAFYLSNFNKGLALATKCEEESRNRAREK